MALIPQEEKLYRQAYDKLNIYKVFSDIDFVPHDGQKKMFDNIQRRDAWFHTIAAGRRFGKTIGIAALATTRLLLPYASVALIAPKYKNAENLFKETYKSILKLESRYSTRLIKSQNKTNLSFELVNGSTFTSVSEKNIDSILGSKVSTIIVDEGADVAILVDHRDVDGRGIHRRRHVRRGDEGRFEDHHARHGGIVATRGGQQAVLPLLGCQPGTR